MALQKNLYKDFVLNIVGSAILTIATQLLAYPFLGRMLSTEEYGTMLTAMAFANAIGASLGGSLNNTRILLQGDYAKLGICGDYNCIAVLLAVPGVLISFIAVSLLYGGPSSFAAGTAVITALVLMRSYYMVAFRIVINYKKVVIANCIGFIGYVIGIGVSYITKWWPTVFIFGEVAVLVFLFKASPLFREGLGRTSLFKTSLLRFGVLFSATAIGQAMTYMDRFLIYPTLGAELVSVFTVASLLGKTVGIVAAPIAGVLLTYYAKEEAALEKRTFYRRVAVCTILCLVSYVAVMLASGPILSVLYPDYVDIVDPYLPISNAGAIVLILGNLIQPTLLKSADNRWQPVIQGIHLVTYLILSLWLSSVNGLYGFCLGVLIANTVRLFAMMLVMHLSLERMLLDKEQPR